LENQNVTMQPSYHDVSPLIAVITSFVSASDFDLIEAGFPDEVGTGRVTILSVTNRQPQLVASFSPVVNE
jgi:hypothetical protein